MSRVREAMKECLVSDDGLAVERKNNLILSHNRTRNLNFEIKTEMKL